LRPNQKIATAAIPIMTYLASFGIMKLVLLAEDFSSCCRPFLAVLILSSFFSPS
jgi:hypothetical protein